MRAGMRVGRYLLTERIAVGGMAEVWGAKARGPQGFEKDVAIKFILEVLRGNDQHEQLFVREAQLAAGLQHPNLVSVLDFNKIDDSEPDHAGRYYIVMERVEGFDLDRVMKKLSAAGQPFPVRAALHVTGE